jgi:hypothetical protein
MADLRPPFVAALDAFGVAATVVVPDGDPVETRVLWQPPITEEYPKGGDHRRATPRRRMAVPLADVPHLPRGTVITAAEVLGQTAVDWSVDETERVDNDHHRVVVLPVSVP